MFNFRFADDRHGEQVAHRPPWSRRKKLGQFQVLHSASLVKMLRLEGSHIFASACTQGLETAEPTIEDGEIDIEFSLVREFEDLLKAIEQRERRKFGPEAVNGKVVHL